MWKQLLLSKSNPAKWIATVYIVVGILWIIFSDRTILMVASEAKEVTLLQTYKGWFFVLSSGLLIYILMFWAIKDLRKVESSLIEKEIMQRNFFERFSQPLWQINEEGYCIFSNRKWKDLTNFTLEQNKIFPWLDLIHVDDKPYCLNKFNEMLTSQVATNLEYRILLKEGEYHWVMNSCIPNFTSSGRFDGITGFLIDINDKKLLEERYRESSRRYGYLFMNNPNPMLVYDNQDLKILEVNKAALHLYGYSEIEFLGLGLTDLRPATEIPKLMDHLADGVTVYNRSTGWKHKRKDGSIFDAEIIGHSLPSSDKRNTRLVIVNDISDQIKAFETVKEGEQRFRSIFEHAPEGEIIFSEKLKILDINPSACEILGLSRETALKSTPFRFIAEDSKDLFNQSIRELEKGMPVKGNANLIHSNGSAFRCEWHGVSFNEKGVNRYYFSFRDVDANYKMQLALMESQRMNATLLANLPGMVYRCQNNPRWTMLFVSDGVLNLTGYMAEELINDKAVIYNDIIHPSDRDHVNSIVQEKIREGRSFEMFYRIIKKDRIIRWVWEQGQGVYLENGELDYIEGYIMDVTREKEANQQVEFQSYFLSLIIDNIPFPLFYKDIHGKYMGCNKAFCDYLGLEKEKILGYTVFDIFSVEQANIFYEKDQELIMTGEYQTYETEITFPGGKNMNAMFHKSVFYDPDYKPLGIIGVYFDITERVKAEQIIKRQLEELARINSELERFTYTVSHDLRSPLVTIKGFLGLLKDDIEEQNAEQINDDLMRIDDATDKMHQLLEGLLELSRLGRIVNTHEELMISRIANEAKELLFGIIKNKNCQIEIQEDMPVVYGDRALLRELFQNLIENAIKFTRKSPNPTISIYSRKGSDSEVVYCVSDNGIGINPAYHEKIFGLFNKLDSSTSGTGIGLSLVKRIVEKHYGKIWVESQGDNTGTVFCFTLNTEKSMN